MSSDTGVPAQTSTGPEDGPSPVDMASLVGTWAAVLLALVALIGIVGPWLALRASYSGRNLALNAVRDQKNEYVTQGIRLGTKTTLFRRVRFPNLAPTYATNSATVPKLYTRADDTDLLRFDFPNFKKWNTGWAMLAAAVESCTLLKSSTHSMEKIATNTVPRDGDPHEDDGGTETIVEPHGGSVEIINSLTAGVVSRYWVLLLGLLGRYGSFPTKTDDPLDPQDFYSNRIDAQNEMDDISDTTSELSVPESLRSERPVQQQYGQALLARYRLSLGRFGTWELTNEPAAVISGFTGRFRSLGHQKSERAILTAIAFYGRTIKEAKAMLGDMAAAALPDDIMEEVEPLSVNFWLANGFVMDKSNNEPHADQRQHPTYTVLSLLDPAPNDKLKDFLTETGRENRIHAREYLKLKEAGVNEDINKGARAINESKWATQLWAASPDEHQNEDQWCTVWLEDPLGRTKTIHLWKDDGDKTSQGLLSIEWPIFGYLTWKHNCTCWQRMMIDASELLRPTFYSNSQAELSRYNLYRDQLQVELKRLATNDQQWAALRVIFDWQPEVYHPHKTAEYVLAANTLAELMEKDHRWAKVPLGGLLMTSRALRSAVYTILDQRIFPPAAVHATIESLDRASNASKQVAGAVRDARQSSENAAKSTEIARVKIEEVKAAAERVTTVRFWTGDTFFTKTQEAEKAAGVHHATATAEAANASAIASTVEKEAEAVKEAYEQTKMHARAVAGREPASMETIEAAAEQIGQAAQETVDRVETVIAGKEFAAVVAAEAMESATAAVEVAWNARVLSNDAIRDAKDKAAARGVSLSMKEQLPGDIDGADDTAPEKDQDRDSSVGLEAGNIEFDGPRKEDNSPETDRRNDYIRKQVEDREDGTGRRTICNNFRLSIVEKRFHVEWDTQKSTTLSIDGIPFRQKEGSLHTEKQTAFWPVNRGDPIDLPEDTLLLIAAWTAVRCELWLSSNDSRPLIKFVKSLDQNVFVM